MFLIFRKSNEWSRERSWQLNSVEIRHAKARRLTASDEVWVGDGGGIREKCVLKSGWSLTRTGTMSQSQERRIAIFTAIPEQPRWEWMLQKLTELGVTEIVPVLYHRSEKKGIQAERSQRILEEAASQSSRFFLPSISARIPSSELPAVLAQRRAEGFQCAWLSLTAKPFSGSVSSGSNDSQVIVVGPEGGFSDREIADLSAFHARNISSQILRVETAAVAACALAGAGVQL